MEQQTGEPGLCAAGKPGLAESSDASSDTVAMLEAHKGTGCLAAAALLNIISSIPLTVSGTVAAQQSGNWNVGITGTPTVNANVTFPSSLPVHNLDDPGRIPYQALADMSLKCSLDVCTFAFGPIPQGRRLVLQHVSGSLVFSGNATSAQAFVFAGPAGGVVPSSSFALPVSGPLSSFDQNILMYFDGGQNVIVNAGVIGTAFSGSGGEDVTVTGYLLDCSAASCADIVTK